MNLRDECTIHPFGVSKGTCYRIFRNVVSSEAIDYILNLNLPPHTVRAGYTMAALPLPEAYGGFLITYGPGAFKAIHLDPAPPKLRHMRALLMVQKPTSGGNLLFYNDFIERIRLEPGDVVLFRADKIHHQVSPVYNGERIVLTYGWLEPEDSPHHAY